jgi:hypothetical protein
MPFRIISILTELIIKNFWESGGIFYVYYSNDLNYFWQKGVWLYKNNIKNKKMSYSHRLFWTNMIHAPYLRNSMKKSSSWESNRHTACQEIFNFSSRTVFLRWGVFNPSLNPQPGGMAHVHFIIHFGKCKENMLTFYNVLKCSDFHGIPIYTLSYHYFSGRFHIPYTHISN